MSLDARFWDRDFETRPWGWIEAWQAQQVATMLESLPQRSELYRQLLDAAGQRVGLRGYWVSRGRLPTLDQMELVPFTTREQLRQAQEAPPPGRPLGRQQAVPQEYVVQVVSSAGTAGRPVFYGLTRRDQEIWSDAIACSFWTAGIRPHDVVAHLAGRPVGADGWPCADGLRRLGAMVAWLDGHTPEQVLDRLQLLRVTAILTSASLGACLAEHEIAEPGPGVRKLLVTRDPGREQPEETRRRLAQSWGIGHVRETMGLADVMAGMWSECEDASGMHFNAGKYVMVELIDPQTGVRLPWSEGARGEAVYTTFDRDATPVVRYRSGDHLQVTATRCACGRTSPKVRRAGHAAELLADAARSAEEPSPVYARPSEAEPNGDRHAAGG